MKNVAVFIKTTILSGLFVLLPLLLLYLILTEIFDLVIALAGPIIDLLPPEAYDEQGERNVLAIIIIIGISFLIGLFSLTESGRRFGHWLEDSTVGHLSVYNVIKKLTQGFTESSVNTFKPALFETFSGVWDLVYLVEEHGNGKATILLPSAPTAFAGPLKIVERNRVTLLNVNLAEFTKVLGQWGVGTSEIKIKENSTD